MSSLNGLSSLASPCSEDEVILEWLRAEIQSDRFSVDLKRKMEELSIGVEVIEKADISNTTENQLRKQLMEFRGYLSRTGLFESLPQNMVWTRLVVDSQTLIESVFYICYSYWEKISKGTRQAVNAARFIQSGKTAFDAPNDRFLKIAQDYATGKDMPKMILVGDQNKVVVLEGHARLTGLALAGKAAPKEITVYLGKTEDLSGWSLY